MCAFKPYTDAEVIAGDESLYKVLSLKRTNAIILSCSGFNHFTHVWYNTIKSEIFLQGSGKILAIFFFSVNYQNFRIPFTFSLKNLRSSDLPRCEEKSYLWTSARTFLYFLPSMVTSFFSRSLAPGVPGTWKETIAITLFGSLAI